MRGATKDAEQLGSLVERMARLKAEHRPLLERISADPGMTPETRSALVAHLYDEEEQLVLSLQAALAASAPTSSATPHEAAGARATSATGRLTVGSLRPAGAAASMSVGSLRRS